MFLEISNEQERQEEGENSGFKKLQFDHILTVQRTNSKRWFYELQD